MPFKAITLEAVIDALSDAGASEIANALWRRYCDFERVYHVALQEAATPSVIAAQPNSVQIAPSLLPDVTSERLGPDHAATVRRDADSPSAYDR